MFFEVTHVDRIFTQKRQKAYIRRVVNSGWFVSISVLAKIFDALRTTFTWVMAFKTQILPIYRLSVSVRSSRIPPSNYCFKAYPDSFFC